MNKRRIKQYLIGLAIALLGAIAPGYGQVSEQPWSTDSFINPSELTQPQPSLSSSPNQPYFEPGQKTPELPTLLVSMGAEAESGMQQVVIPDWQNISLGDLPPLTQSGQIEAIDRQWYSGQKPDFFLNLGDLAESLQVQLLSLGRISQQINLDLGNQPLSRVPLLSRQTLTWLAKVVPGMGDRQLRDLPLLASWLTREYPQIDRGQTLSSFLTQHPQAAQLQLEQLPLADYQFADFPNLMGVRLEKFSDWQLESVQAIPGLAQLPLADYPVPVTAQGQWTAEITDLNQVNRPTETIEPTATGSSTYGFTVPCEENCDFIKLEGQDDQPFYWIAGESQMLAGGTGCLQDAQLEPTGRHPFGSLFKVVVTDIDRSSERIQTGLFFRLSHTCGQSAYGVGPIPFLTFSVGSKIFLGSSSEEMQLAQVLGNSDSTSSRSFSESSNNCLSSNPIERPNEPTFGDIRVRLATASLSQIFERQGATYDRVGTLSCSEERCHRPIGKYGFWSDERDIKAQLSGSEGELIHREILTQQQLLELFPPQVQDRLLRQRIAALLEDFAQKNDPELIATPYSGDRLLARVITAYFGGNAILAEPQFPANLVLNPQLELSNLADKTIDLYRQLDEQGRC